MARKFRCEKCGASIVVKWMEHGGTVKCRGCGAEVTVPENTVEVSAEVAEEYLKPAKDTTQEITSLDKIQKIETRDCVDVLRFMAWGYLWVSIAGAIAVWYLYGDNPLGIAQGFAVLVQGLLMCPFFLCIASIAEDTGILTSEQRKEQAQVQVQLELAIEKRLEQKS